LLHEGAHLQRAVPRRGRRAVNLKAWISSVVHLEIHNLTALLVDFGYYPAPGGSRAIFYFFQ
jgi:hypothetical protein